MATLRQTSFSAGELDPKLQGRTDLPIYAHGLKTCRNFFISREGAAVSRPGTRFVNEAKVIAEADYTGGVTPDRPVRLVPFVAGDRASAVLEFGEQYVRFHTLGQTLESAPDTPLELAAPYLARDLAKLRFAQVGDVLTIVAAGYTPFQLRRNSATDWEFEGLEVSPPVAMFADPVGGTVTSSPYVVTGTIAVADPTHPAREWNYLVTTLYIDPVTGAVRETLGQRVLFKYDGTDFATRELISTANPKFEFVIYPDKPLTLRRAVSGVEEPPLGVKVLRNIYYRGRGGIYGYVGETDTRDFIDLGAEPDYSVQPPLGTDPFAVAYDGVAGRETPWSVAFFQDRLIFGGSGIAGSATQRRPNTLITSKTGDYSNFDTRLSIHVSGEALLFDLAAYRREDITHLVQRDRLVVLTNSTAWTFGGGPTAPLDFDSVDARITDDVGSSDARPIVVDGCVLFVRTKGSGARALVPQASDTPYQGIDVSKNARHLVVGKQRSIVDWAYAEDPWGLIWAVRADGGLLSLTFDKDDGLSAWARHDTDGSFEAVCSVPEGEEDAVYVVVKRDINGNTKRYIERLTSRVRRVTEDDADPEVVSSPGIDDIDSLYPSDLCSDCSFTYAGAVPATNAIEGRGLQRLVGKYAYITGRNMPVLGPYLVNQFTATTGTIALPEDFTPTPNAVDVNGTPIWVAHIGLAFTADLETLSVRGDATLRQKTVTEVGFELDQTKGLKAGQDFDHLSDWEQREVSDGYDPPSAADVLLVSPVENIWDRNARACLRQSLPLPVTVLGISREVEAGDR